MATGRVLQFDPNRGYGFVAADDGGEDVFLHASVFHGDSSELVPGIPLEFQIVAGDRGRKAFAVRVAGRAFTAPRVCSGVLSQSELEAELTELLLRTIPALTGAQILEVRQGLLQFARTRGLVSAR